MRKLFVTHHPQPALGMTSVVLGIISLLLAFLPVLGVPLGAIGLVCGILGIGVAWLSPRVVLRWSVAGVAVCVLALGVNVALTLAPSGYIPARHVMPPWEPPPDRPSNPPPAHRGVDWGRGEVHETQVASRSPGHRIGGFVPIRTRRREQGLELGQAEPAKAEQDLPTVAQQDQLRIHGHDVVRG